MNPITLTFLAAMGSLNPIPNCNPPEIVFSTETITKLCQPLARKGNTAKACYMNKTIYLPTSWDAEREFDAELLRYEMLRHVTQACLHKSFNTGEKDFRQFLRGQE